MKLTLEEEIELLRLMRQLSWRKAQPPTKQSVDRRHLAMHRFDANVNTWWQ